MSIRAFLVGLMFLGTFGLSAARADSPNHFTQLETFYQQGTVPTRADLVGWYSGRCFQADTPDLPRNSLLIGWIEDGTPDGPIFPPGQDVLKIFYMKWGDGTQGGPDFFDRLDEESAYQIQTYFDGPEGKVTSLETSMDQGAILGGSKTLISPRWHLRKYQNYVLMRWTEGDIVRGYCYSFLKIK